MAGRRGRKEKAPDFGKARSEAAIQLGETIRAWRHARHYSIGRLAELADLGAAGAAYISKLEHGRIERIGNERLQRLAAALGASEADILGFALPDTSARQVERAAATARHTAIKEAATAALEARVEDAVTASLRAMMPRFRAEARLVLAESLPRILDAARQEQEIELFQRILRQAGHGRPLLKEIGATGGPVQRIAGTVECMRAAIQLIESAPSLEPSDLREIIITWRGRESLIENAADPLLRQQWISALRAALDRGWTIRHLLHVGDNQRKALLVVLNILALLGSNGLYRPQQLDPAHGPAPDEEARDFIVVPGQGIIELRGLALGLYYPPGACPADAEEALDVLGAEATPLYQEFPRFSIRFTEAIRKAEESPGDRDLAMDGLSESLVPEAIHRVRAEPFLARGGAVARFVEELLESRRRRVAAIEHHLRTYRYRDLCTERAIARLAREGITSPDDPLRRLGAPVLTHDQRLVVLRALVERMRRYQRYELILLPDSLADLCRTFYLAKAGYAVLLEFWRPAGSGVEAPEDPASALDLPPSDRDQNDLLITDPTIVRAFQENPLWQPYNTFSPVRRRQTITFLEEQIEWLLSEGGAAGGADG
ncbi:MAG TPA: helix-turn-helix transcriptional regulator [Ktedonobacterales bacterium]